MTSIEQIKEDINVLKERFDKLDSSKSKEEKLKFKREAEEIKVKTSLLERELILNESKFKQNSLFDNILVLRFVMSSAVPVGTLSDTWRPLFSDDELLPYKAKMLELIKKL